MADEQLDSFEFSLSPTVLASIAAKAAESVGGVHSVKVRMDCSDTAMTADVTVKAFYGGDLHQLALDVQQHVADALRTMTDPPSLSVHVTINELVRPDVTAGRTGGKRE